LYIRWFGWTIHWNSRLGYLAVNVGKTESIKGSSSQRGRDPVARRRIFEDRQINHLIWTHETNRLSNKPVIYLLWDTLVPLRTDKEDHQHNRSPVVYLFRLGMLISFLWNFVNLKVVIEQHWQNKCLQGFQCHLWISGFLVFVYMKQLFTRGDCCKIVSFREEFDDASGVLSILIGEAVQRNFLNLYFLVFFELWCSIVL